MRSSIAVRGLMSRSREQFVSVLGPQVRCQPAHAAQMEPLVRDRGKDRGELPSRSGGVNTLRGDVFGHVQLVHAIRMHRMIARRRVEFALIKFRDVGEQDCGGRSILSENCLEIAREFVIPEMTQRVGAHDSRSFHGGAPCSRARDQGPRLARACLMHSMAFFCARRSVESASIARLRVSCLKEQGLGTCRILRAMTHCSERRREFRRVTA